MFGTIINGYPFILSPITDGSHSSDERVKSGTAGEVDVVDVVVVSRIFAAVIEDGVGVMDS